MGGEKSSLCPFVHFTTNRVFDKCKLKREALKVLLVDNIYGCAV